jgi:hypothetical protein
MLFTKSFPNPWPIDSNLISQLPFLKPNQPLLLEDISPNVILTQKIIHSFMPKSWTPQAFLLKIDLAKAFDRLEWSFITQSLHRLGFNSHFIKRIHTCISSSSLSILVNQQPTSYFYPQRGLRQGCPLSPYLFEIAGTADHFQPSRSLLSPWALLFTLFFL